MRPPMTPMEFAAAVTEPGLSMDQVQQIIRDDLDAELAAIQARRQEREATADVVALPAPTAHHEEVSA